MSLWETRFRMHQLWPAVSQAREVMNIVAMPDDAGDREVLAYAGMVLELLEKRRDETDTLEVTPTMLSTTASAASGLATALQYVHERTWAWSQLVQPVDEVLSSLASWPPMRPARYLAGVSQATELFVRKTNDALDAVKARSEGVDADLVAVGEKATKLAGRIDDEQQRISESIAEFTTSSAKAVAEVIGHEQQRIDDHMGGWTRDRDEAGARAEELIQRLGQHEEAAKNVVHATTARVVATDYGKYARNKTLAAWVVDLGAAAVGAAGVGFLLFHLFTMDADVDANVGLSLTRLAVSIGTLGIATLLGKRAHQHHQEARAAKRTDLALRQVLPFTANLDSDEREEVVLSFTERVFIRGDLDIAGTAMPGPSLRERIATRRRTREDREAKARAVGIEASGTQG